MQLETSAKAFFCHSGQNDRIEACKVSPIGHDLLGEVPVFKKEPQQQLGEAENIEQFGAVAGPELLVGYLALLGIFRQHRRRPCGDLPGKAIEPGLLRVWGDVAKNQAQDPNHLAEKS